MTNYLDYVKGVGHYRMDQLILTNLDLLALTEIAYLAYDHILGAGHQMTLEDLALQYITENGFSGKTLSVITKPRIQLLSHMGTAERYKHIQAGNFVNDISTTTDKQFSAMTFQLPMGHVIVFKGTDESLVGWKEDFKMTFLNEVPSQLAAQAYLKDCLERFDGDIWVSGHSKGGNLGIFASSRLPLEEQARIRSIVAFDAPGLHESILASEGFLAIRDKIVSYVPQDSVVSVLLGEPINAQVVKSKGLLLLQHDTVTWEISFLDFVSVDSRSEFSSQTDKTISEWLSRLTLQDKQDFVDVVFSILSDAEIYEFGDITSNTPSKIFHILNGMANLSADQKRMATRVIGHFVGTQADLFKEQLPEPIRTTGSRVERLMKGIFRFKPKAKALPALPPKED